MQVRVVTRPAFAIIMVVIICGYGCAPESKTEVPPALDMGVQPIEYEVIPALEALAQESDYEPSTPGYVALRRLTRPQYNNVIKDLFGSDIEIPRILEPDVTRSGLRNVGASEVSYSPRGVESIESASYAISAQVVSNALLYAEMFPCEPPSDDACLDTSLASLMTRIFRRPPTEAELATTRNIVRNAETRLDSIQEGVSFGIAALLQSPHFLFRGELGNTDSGDLQFTSYEMASRLSFFLWNSMPDAMLFERAALNQLKTRAQIYEAARRMMGDLKFKHGLRAYFDDALELYELAHLSKDPKIFEHFDPELGPSAAEETWRLIEHLVFEEPSDFRDLMTANFTFVNPRLATIYGVPAPAESGFARLPLDPSAQRAGLLGHVSFLALHSHSTVTSATRRGEAVRTRLLCQEIPSPPVNVDTSIPEPTGTRRTLRERVAEHLADPSCIGCHQLTDPIGLGLENFDSIGRFRSLDNGAEIDPTGDLDGEAFDNPIELGQRLRDHPSYAPCVVQKIVEYGVGRALVSDERGWMRILVERFETHGFLLQPLILEFVTSPVFTSPGTPLEESE
jgi:hypothetical protein